jgi:hypothetical protein
MIDKIIAWVCGAALFFLLGMNYQEYATKVNQEQAKEVHCGVSRVF